MENFGSEGWGYAAYEKALKKSFTLHKPTGVTEGNGPLQITLASPETLWRRVHLQRWSSQIVEARKEVIICAGAINSPRILELSGIGDADLLQRLGINVVVDNPHVGENLQDHLFTGLTFEARDDVETIDAFSRQEPDAVAAVMQEYATKGTGY
ncbi:hypothetical protein EAF00_005590 [Botryotinia globosa]|nr:hypothetical protein EAF00_005590 [Botryotinia globosa]